MARLLLAAVATLSIARAGGAKPRNFHKISRTTSRWRWRHNHGKTMKLNFWQWLGVALLIFAAIWFVYHNFVINGDAAPQTTPPTTTSAL